MNKTQARRGPYAKTRERWAAVAEATLQLVDQKGYRNVTTADVAEACGLTEANVLYQFPSKDHLFVAALEWTAQRAEEETALDHTIPIEEGIAAAATASVQHPHVLHLFVRMIAEACDPDHPANAWNRATKAKAHHYYAETLRRLKTEGYAHPDVEPGRFALQFGAIWDGLQAEWLADPTFDLAAELLAAFRTLTRHEAVLARRAMAELVAEL